jgi:hemolysin III
VKEILRSHAVAREEFANTWTHGIGIPFSVVGFSILLFAGVLYGSFWHIASFLIYGTSLVLVYLCSTLYHVFSQPEVKRLLRTLDHICIYLLIAGTYTPFALVNFRADIGWSLFCVVWGLALAGVVFKFFCTHRFTFLSTAVYLGMGWMSVLLIDSILAHIPFGGIMWLMTGGLAYTFGVIFFAWERLPYNHAIWHLFVLFGSFCHYVAVLFYVLPHE